MLDEDADYDEKEDNDEKEIKRDDTLMTETDDPYNVFVVADEERYLRLDESPDPYYQSEKIIYYAYPDIENVRMCILCIFLFKDQKKGQHYDEGRYIPWPLRH